MEITVKGAVIEIARKMNHLIRERKGEYIRKQELSLCMPEDHNFEPGESCWEKRRENDSRRWSREHYARVDRAETGRMLGRTAGGTVAPTNAAPVGGKANAERSLPRQTAALPLGGMSGTYRRGDDDRG
jgi:hypothetical protein